MSRPNVAAARFYDAFYHWNLINARHPHSRLPRRVGLPARIHCRRTFGTTTVRCQGGRAISNDDVVAERVREDARRSVQSWMESQPIQSPSDAPLEAHTPWQVAVRSRSDHSVVLSIAVPSTQLQEARKSYGSGLEELQTLYGVKIELGPGTTRKDEDGKTSVIFSVSVEGRGFSPLAELYNVLRGASPVNLPRDAAANLLSPHLRPSIAETTTPRQSTTPELSELAGTLRKSLRKLTNAAVLITSNIPGSTEISDPCANSRGLTVSSFTAVTLGPPSPFLSFNLKVSSRTWDAIMRSSELFVHILANNAQGVGLADLFTKPHKDPAEPFRQAEELGATVGCKGELESQLGILTRIRANLAPEKCVRVGDHVVVIAEVVEARPGDHRLLGRDESALAYGEGSFRAQGQKLHALSPSEMAASEDAPNQEKLNGGRQHGQDSQPSNANHPKRTQKRSFATARNQTILTGTLSSARAYCTNSPSAENPEGLRSPNNAKPDPRTLVTDPALLETTVDTFLGTSVGPKDLPRMRSLAQAAKNVRIISRSLRYHTGMGTMTPERSMRLKQIISHNERRLVGKLAPRAAADLRRMLDMGTVDVRLAQWLEKTVEAGQVGIAEQYTEGERLVEEAKISRGKWEDLKQGLEAEEEELRIELGRLRAWMEEEDYGLPPASEDGDFSGDDGRRMITGSSGWSFR